MFWRGGDEPKTVIRWAEARRVSRVNLTNLIKIDVLEPIVHSLLVRVDWAKHLLCLFISLCINSKYKFQFSEKRLCLWVRKCFWVRWRNCRAVSEKGGRFREIQCSPRSRDVPWERFWWSTPPPWVDRAKRRATAPQKANEVNHDYATLMVLVELQKGYHTNRQSSLITIYYAYGLTLIQLIGNEIPTGFPNYELHWFGLDEHEQVTVSSTETLRLARLIKCICLRSIFEFVIRTHTRPEIFSSFAEIGIVSASGRTLEHTFRYLIGLYFFCWQNFLSRIGILRRFSHYAKLLPKSDVRGWSTSTPGYDEYASATIFMSWGRYRQCWKFKFRWTASVYLKTISKELAVSKLLPDHCKIAQPSVRL